MRKLWNHLKFMGHEIAGTFRAARSGERVIGHTTLSAVVTVGSEESAAIWSERLGRTVKAGEQIDLGEISHGDMTITVEAGNG